MRWPRWLLVIVAEAASGVFAAAVGLITNILSSQKHPAKGTIIGGVVFLALQVAVGATVRIVEGRQAAASERDIKAIKNTADEILSRQVEADTGRTERELHRKLDLCPPIFIDWIQAQWKEDASGIEKVLSDITDLETRPIIVVEQWERNLPAWFNSLGWRATLVAAELAGAYGSPKLMTNLFLSAASASTREHYWVARAALALKTQGDSDKAKEILDRANVSSDSAEAFAQIVYALVHEDRESTQALIDGWTPVASIDALLAANIRVILLSMGVEASEAQSPDLLSKAAGAFRRLIKRIPDSAAARISLAEILLKTAASGAYASRRTDLDEALEHSLRARDLCRAMRSSSVHAVELACQAAYFQMSARRVIEIGTAGTGEATIDEANSDIVRTLVASAALATHQFNISDSIIPEISDSFHKPLLIAMSAEVRGQTSGPLWYDALRQARNVDERIQALLGLARTGATDLPGIEEIRSASPHTATLIQAVSGAALGDTDSAIRQLRAIPGTDFNAIAGLASVYLQVGNINAAVGVLREGARALNDSRLRLEAARILWENDKKDQAVTELEAILIDSGSDLPMRHECLNLLGQLAADQEDWVTAQRRFQELVTLFPNESLTRWSLILILLRRGLTPQARQVYESAPAPLQTTHPDHARAWMALAIDAPSRDQDRLVNEIIDVATEFPDDEYVQAEAILSVLSPTTGKDGPLQASTQQRFDSFCERFFNVWPNSSKIRRITGKDAHELLVKMEEMVRPSSEDRSLQAQVADQIARNILPWAFLSVFTNRPYAELVIVRAGGILPARHFDPVEQQMCREAARSAIDNNVVIDISAAAVLGDLPQLKDTLIGMFESLTVAEGQRLDATAACNTLRRRSTSTWVYDEQNDRGRIAEITEEIADQRYDKASILLRLLNDCRISPVATSEHFNQLGKLATPSWATAIEASFQAGVAFWCDDVALRAVARSIGVVTFSTPSLLEVLLERDIVDSRQHENAVRTMIEALIGDFSIIQDRLTDLLTRHWGLPGPIASVFSRPGAWINLNEAFKIWCELIRRVARFENSYVADWLYAAVIGIARPQKVASLRQEASAMLLSWAVISVADIPDEVLNCVTAARAGLSAVRSDPGDDDPLARATKLFYTSMIQIVGIQAAYMYVSSAFSKLEGPDHQEVLQILYAS